MNRLPLILAIVLLLLPVLYVGSYLALVGPRASTVGVNPHGQPVLIYDYRFQADAWASRVFWPLEQIDRRIRPKAWERWW